MRGMQILLLSAYAGGQQGSEGCSEGCAEDEEEA